MTQGYVNNMVLWIYQFIVVRQVGLRNFFYSLSDRVTHENKFSPSEKESPVPLRSTVYGGQMISVTVASLLRLGATLMARPNSDLVRSFCTCSPPGPGCHRQSMYRRPQGGSRYNIEINEISWDFISTIELSCWEFRVDALKTNLDQSTRSWCEIDVTSGYPGYPGLAGDQLRVIWSCTIGIEM